MNQLTIRGFGRDLEEKIRSLAEVENISLNKAAVRLLRRGAGLDQSDEWDPIGNSLDHFFGTWSAEEKEFMDKVEEEF
ncbi:MAG TPA: hypothetical protein VLU25_17795 [Acidobacteriota bacterium]|nr:hypothetical protein [Acidobacteriota bacterium]